MTTKDDPIDIMPLLVTVAQAAWLMSISKETVHKMIRDGEIPSVQVRTVRRIRTADIHRFIHDNTEHPMLIEPDRETIARTTFEAYWGDTSERSWEGTDQDHYYRTADRIMALYRGDTALDESP